ncbi:hypothetical protein [Endozoicomonas elysicola]|uniref:Lipoprotein n=1 Tax=Endozoicomonas elysicola TaxID=305900 RepID=A0A081KEW9_9GAMM|nr:hypothetical protein [Endozoicomonas elysicola]KEI72695.1 hypothetical protein GV64_19955 [Endozoicomonas elysicola]
MKHHFFALLSAVLLAGCSPSKEPEPLKSSALTAPEFIGQSATAKPFQGSNITHPFMAKAGKSTIHGDGFNSDVHLISGPLGINPQIQTRDGSNMPGGMCATVTITTKDQLIALCASIAGFEIHMLKPRSLELLARFKLPNRPSSFQALVKRDPTIVMTDTSGGAYYYLDDQDRVVLADSTQRIIRLANRQTETGEWEFYLDGSWDLSHEVPNDCMNWNNWFPDGECDPITAVLPDHKGLIWWVTRYGRVGTLNPETGRVKSTQFKGEEIQNSFAMDENAAYVVTDHATYAMNTDARGKPTVLWQEAYDRGSARKVGSINQGSGTTPTLLGDRYITVTDNADERINLLVYRRQPDFNGQRLICTVPLFENQQSATENSMVGWGRTIIIENNFGYSSAVQQKEWDVIPGGITRIDIRKDESGCDVVWNSPEKAPSVVPKLSADNGLVYFYTFEQQKNAEDVAWYLMALDANSGKTAFKIRTGAGMAFDNNWAPITIGTDGTAYVGTIKGIIAIWDEPQPALSQSTEHGANQG